MDCFSATKVSHLYYMTISADGRHLYISDHERYQVLRILSLEEGADPRTNFEVSVGSGDRCIPGDVEKCGDGGHALRAKLTHPKGRSFKKIHFWLKYHFS